MSLHLTGEISSVTLDRDAYLKFLQSKFQFGANHGAAVAPGDIHPMLKPHQRDIVQWAVRKGRAAIFASFGLGKSFMQLEICRLLCGDGRGLIIAPLGVRQEFRADAEKLGIPLRFIRFSDQAAEPGLYITNYESVRDGKLDMNLFKVVSLDEASVLRSFGSKTYQEFLLLGADVQYRFVATATPSPNSYKELIHYAGFLGIMDTGQALTRFFQRDSEKANNLTIYPHMEREFFLWLHSWAAFVSKPSDLGYPDDGYDMPELIVHYHQVRAGSIAGGIDREGQGLLLKDVAGGLKEAATEKRDSIAERIQAMLGIIRDAPDDHFILWHDLEAERHAIQAALPEASSVYGSLDLDIREGRITAFANGETKYLSTKPEISGSGCNLQRYCHKAIFLGIGYKFNDFIQSIHRIRRFLQPHQCEIHIIYSDTEIEILKTLQRKWREHDMLTLRMSGLIEQHGLSTMGAEADLARTIGVDRQEARGERFMVAHNDCIMETAMMPDDCIDHIVTSIPFGNHYEYSTSFEDFGHNDDNVRFFEQMDFLTPNLLRILKPGRIFACHVKDRVRFGNVTGYGMPSIEPFHADCIAHYRRHGFIYCGMIHVNTDVVRENAQTYRLGWTEMCKDGTKMGVGCPEYVLLFRKLPSDTSRGYADEPVVKDKREYTRARWQIDAHAFWRSSGDRFLTAAELEGYGPDKMAALFPRKSLERIYDYEQHVAVAEALEAKNRLPAGFGVVMPGAHREDTWHDVNRMRTLNGRQALKNMTQHICPLQFDIVDRLIERFSAKGETVFDPFGGLFTVPYCAIKLGRYGRAVELNAEYYNDGLVHLREADREAAMGTLFQMEDIHPPKVAA